MAGWTLNRWLFYALRFLATALDVTAQYPPRPPAPWVPFGLAPDYGLDDVAGRASVIQEALQALGLRQVLPTIRTAKDVVYAHMPNTVPGFYGEPLVVLAVDCSFHWFNVGLYAIDEIGLVDTIEGTVKGLRTQQDNQLDELRDTLRYLFANAPPNVNLPMQIHHLIVYGDDAKDDALHHLLATILGAVLVREAHFLSSVFDCLTHVARFAHEVMDTIDFEWTVPSAFSCRGQAKLHRENHNEL
ncbi:hypothetical protein K458DRAFT_405273 [Lentithecium fluviatile CBS 122367]|uniref:Ubiquitin-like protease family profile domain-containing protein n=1 Tax=Lentithecium fluviatile CBS 122367 TaxID=1168545 RepID=A0A6G1IYG2_9PLEO|nr:hypothetical protein K458DRAFT_405273 [Lentithecium fluviatile CBS 122367]